eukprot:SAG11_NODE_1957_length_4002_cov_4.816551_3_plen_145_part_00
MLESLLMFCLLSTASKVIFAFIILHLKHSTFSVLELVLKVYLSKLHKLSYDKYYLPKLVVSKSKVWYMFYPVLVPVAIFVGILAIRYASRLLFSAVHRPSVPRSAPYPRGAREVLDFLNEINHRLRVHNEFNPFFDALLDYFRL